MSKLLPKKILLVVMPDYTYICFAFAQHTHTEHSFRISILRTPKELLYVGSTTLYSAILVFQTNIVCEFVLNFWKTRFSQFFIYLIS